MTDTRTLVLNPKQIAQRLNRLAWQVYEQCYDEQEIVVAGIAGNGFRLATRISKILSEISPIKVKLCEVTISKDSPLDGKSSVQIDAKELEGKTVVLVDDVSNSGRTLMYSVKLFLESHVKSIKTLVLVDRDHNRFPVKTNFVGLSLATTMQEHISVVVGENGEDAVYLD
ncbi:MAG: phosphoribosyltransferase family protein [Bacteroidetes bacterium]|jgi:pyrimidine operon attenuation protein/uracil phosphoribosyltransferase|nr:phosphoribosyltransferase family protein [Bacteroidota bacterium]